MAWIPGPFQIRDAVRKLKRVRREGGPTEVRIERLERPRGWILPSSKALLEIDTHSGNPVELTVELPVPWPYAWSYRIARRMNLPLAATLEPDDVRFGLPVPDFIRRRLDDASG